MGHRFLVAVLSLFLLLPPAYGKPLREILSYSDFEKLVMHTAARVPDLEKLWRWGRSKGHTVYIGGGALRGMLHWLHEKLQTRSVDKVKALAVPSFEEFLLQDNSDLDLFLDEYLITSFKNDVPMYAGWDVLATEFWEASVESGGTTLEKVKVSPRGVVDPLNGLYHYYEGRLVFEWTEDSAMRQNDWVRSNSRTAQALRWLRMRLNPPESAFDEESLRMVQGISQFETPILRRDKSIDYWIEKGLRKLYVASGDDLARTLEQLKIGKLLPILAAKGYSIPDAPKIDDTNVDDIAKKLLRLGFTPADLMHVVRMQVEFLAPTMALRWHAMRLVKTPEDFLALAKPTVAMPSMDYKRDLDGFISQNIGAFIALKPDLYQVLALHKSGGIMSTKTAIKLRRAAVPLVKTIRDYNLLVDGSNAPDLTFDGAMAAFMREFPRSKLVPQDQVVPVVVKKRLSNPGNLMLVLLEVVRHTPDTDEKIAILRDRGLPMLYSAGDYVMLVRPHDGATREYRMALDAFVKATADIFASHKPEPAQIREVEIESCYYPETAAYVRNLAGGAGAIRRVKAEERDMLAPDEKKVKLLREQGLPHVSSAAAYLELVALTSNDLNYKRAIDVFIDESLDVFFEQRPTVAEVNALIDRVGHDTALHHAIVLRAGLKLPACVRAILAK